MQKIFFICFFSFLGASARFFITNCFKKFNFPYGTLACNSLACILMGASFAVCVNFIYDFNTLQNTMYAFLGALSTFSTFSHDTYQLFVNKGLFYAFLNVLLNLCFGVILFISGFFGVNLLP